jgi:hypothetical protein
MTKETIAAALQAEGLSASQGGYAIPENREAVCLVGAPGELLSIERLVRIDLADKFLLLENSKRERFFFAYDDVLGLRLLAAASARDRVAGFGR